MEIAIGSILILSVIGFADSLYFTLMYYGIVRGRAGRRATECADDEGTCHVVLDSSYSRILGLPNSVFGLAFYTVTTLVCIERWIYGSSLLLPYAVVAAAIAVAVSIYLAHSLLFRLRTSCPLCFLAHGINVALLILLVVEAAAGKATPPS